MKLFNTKHCNLGEAYIVYRWLSDISILSLIEKLVTKLPLSIQVALYSPTIKSILTLVNLLPNSDLVQLNTEVWSSSASVDEGVNLSTSRGVVRTNRKGSADHQEG